MSHRKRFIRSSFRSAVFSRDGNRCAACGAAEGALDAHHIIDRNELPNGGYVKENGISLCPDCHEKAEMFHSSDKRYWMRGFHPNDLFKIIESSPLEAVWASTHLA